MKRANLSWKRNEKCEAHSTILEMYYVARDPHIDFFQSLQKLSYMQKIKFIKLKVGSTST